MFKGAVRYQNIANRNIVQKMKFSIKDFSQVTANMFL